MKNILINTLVLLIVSTGFLAGQESYLYQSNVTPAWASFENPKALKGEGAQRNKGAKGFASKWITAGEVVTLMEDDGCGIIHRMWLTISERAPEMLRAIKLDMYWDGASKPAVSMPLGDFFCDGTGIKKTFQSALFESPEGRSFVSFVQMPYRKGAKIILTNTSDKVVNLFYDVNFTRRKSLPAEAMYFHAYFNHDKATTLGVDHTILPELKGKGRFLGMSVGVIANNEEYNNNWWGEGEVKIFLDGDAENQPTLVGTGTEDYIGTAWGQGAYYAPYQGCIVAGEKNSWSFYRFHIPDPIYFEKSIKVTLQQIGGIYLKDFQATLDKTKNLIPITVENSDTKEFYRLMELGISDPFSFSIKNGWVNYYRSDNVASTAYFYYEKPVIN